MTKKKAKLEPFSRYAILDMSLEEASHHIQKMYRDHSLVTIKRIGDDQLKIDYKLSPVEAVTVDATARIMRWQGTQIRVMFHVKDHAKSDIIIHEEESASYNDFMVILAIVVGILFIPAVGIMMTRSFIGGLIMLIAFITLIIIRQPFNGEALFDRKPVVSYESYNLNTRVRGAWKGLLKTLALDDDGRYSRLVERGTPATLYHNPSIQTSQQKRQSQ